MGNRLDLIKENVSEARIAPPIRNTLMFHAGGRWILKVDPSGQLELNPDIPQAQLVVDFVSLCNQLRADRVFNRLKCRGVSRLEDNEQALVLYFDRKPTNDEMREIHDEFKNDTV